VRKVDGQNLNKLNEIEAIVASGLSSYIAAIFRNIAKTLNCVAKQDLQGNHSAFNNVTNMMCEFLRYIK